MARHHFEVKSLLGHSNADLIGIADKTSMNQDDTVEDWHHWDPFAAAGDSIYLDGCIWAFASGRRYLSM